MGNLKTDNALLPGVAGTSAMTLYSYLVSGQKERNVREPELLAILLARVVSEKYKPYTPVAGWLAHYGIGIAWARIFQLLLHATGRKASLKNGLLMGTISGLAGIFSWQLLFRIHPRPPRIAFRIFYRQLLVAHLLFSIIAVPFTGSGCPADK